MSRKPSNKSLLFAIPGAVLFSVCTAHPQPPPGYYTSAEGKTGAELRQALHNIIRNHHVIPYSSGTQFDTSDGLKVLDEDPANTNNVIGIYSRESEPKDSFGLTTGWNREHLWCDSYGLDGREPAYSDLHNLRAEDLNVNSSRGNKFFDISDTNSTGFRFPAHVEAPLASTDTDSWEPPATVKGNIARTLFYMMVLVRKSGDSTHSSCVLEGCGTEVERYVIAAQSNDAGGCSVTALKPPAEVNPHNNDRQRERRQLPLLLVGC